MPLFRASCVASALVLMLTAPAVTAQTVGVDWQSTTLITASGDLNGVGVQVFGLINGGAFSQRDLSGPAFAAAPLATNQEMLDYAYNSQWFAAFASPVTDLLIHAKFWRGPDGANDPATYDYTFDRPFTILSGFPGVIVNGNTLRVPSDTFRDGILKFSGTFSSVAVINTNATSASRQLLTFALRDPAVFCTGDIADDFGTLGSDNQVSFGDFLALLGLIGPCGSGTTNSDCTGDIADDFGTLNGGDGMVSFGDFLALLGLIGPCP